MEFAGGDGSDGGRIGRKARIDPVFPGKLGDLEIGAVYDVELTRKGDQEARAVGGEIKFGEAAGADAGAFAAGFFLGGQRFWAGAEQLGGGE